MPARRFYFDDGVKRTFWYIETRGVTQTVLTGKLGSSGRLTTRDFDTPQDARTDTERKADRKCQQGFMEYTPADLTYRRKNRLGPKRLREPRLRAIETDYGLKIPKEFRQYLNAQNGGDPEPGFISIPGHPYIENVAVSTILGVEIDPAYNIRHYIEETSPALPNGHLPIAGMPDLFSVALNRNRGAVYFWDLESLEVEDADEDGNYYLKASQGYLLAHSFDEFLTRLARYPNDKSIPGSRGSG